MRSVQCPARSASSTPIARQITVECAPELAALLAQALRWFVARHYPYGADECSIAAREALLDLAGRFSEELAATGRCHYNGRVRAFLSEALAGYTRHLQETEGTSWTHRSSVLIAVGRGQSRGEDYALAQARDAAAADGGVGSEAG